MVNYLLLIVLHLLGDFICRQLRLHGAKMRKRARLAGNVRNVENTHG